MIEFRIDPDYAKVRLDKFLKKKLPNVPTSHLFKMVRTKKIRVNQKRAQPEQLLAEGDLVSIRGTEQQLLAQGGNSRNKLPSSAAPSHATRAAAERLNILFEDDWMMAIDKPSGLAVHAGSGIYHDTVVELVRAHLGTKAVRNDFAASPAHRLDKDTSGVLIIAKRRPAMVHFTDVFTHHRAKKTYLVLVKGKLAQRSGRIDVPLAERQQTFASKQLRGINMQQAVTHYRLLSQGSQCALVSCTIETGRTHQIRRHFAAIAHPVALDSKYGDFAFNRDVKARWKLNRLFLHAQSLEIAHPETKKKMWFEAPLPDDLKQALHAAGMVWTADSPSASSGASLPGTSFSRTSS